jgi:predicted ATPase/DNA-binding SARP family transcriptional activator
MPAFLQLKLLGRLEARLDGTPITGFRSRQTRRMLGFLALQNGAEVPFDLLAARLWPVPETADPAITDKSALANVRQSVSNLVELLGADRLQKVAKSAVRLLLEDAWIDVAEFDAAIATGTRASLEQAVRLYTGDLMEDCLDAWIEPARHARRQDYQTALRRLAEEAEARLDYLNAEGHLRRLIASDPRREGSRCALMLLLAHQGEYHAAIGVYEEWHRRLADAQLVPGREIEEIYRRVRSAVLRDDPEVDPVETPTYRLPRPLVELVGRGAELAEIRARCTFARFVTLKGPPGVGKTQLALNVAWAAREDYPGGVAFVDLAGVTDPAGLRAEIAAVLGVAKPPPHGEVALLNFLRPRRLLLVLDNCDRIARSGGTVIQRLLQECPYLHLLTTSRIAWWAELGERVIPVAPLRTPHGSLLHRAPEDLVALLPEHAAVRLFLETAENVTPDFALTPLNALAVAQLCRCLDGLPLAIQLVARWANTFSPEEMLASVTAGLDLLRSIDGRNAPRHATLKAAIEAGYGPLAVGVQCFFRRLALFEGGWTYEAAEAVCGEPRAQEYLHLLQEHSLIVSEADAPTRRFRMLETIGQFARDRLAETTDADFLRPRHLDHYLAFSEGMASSLRGPQQESGLERLGREHGNFRKALATARDLGEGEKALRLASALWRFWNIRGHNAEGAGWLERLLAEFKGVDPAVRARALGGAGALALQRADYPRAQAFYTERLGIEEVAGRRRIVAETMGNLANIASYVNDTPRARALYEQSLAHFRDLQDRRNVALTLGNLAVIAMQERNPTVALSYSRESIALLRELQESRPLAIGLKNLADTHRELGNTAEAITTLQESLILALRLEDAETLHLGLLLACYLAAQRNRMKEAAVLLGAAEALRERSDLPLSPRATPEVEQHRALLTKHLGLPVFEEALAHGRRLSASEGVEYVT